MKQQSIGILLSALLFTTFGHEVLHRHQAHHAARHAVEARSQAPDSGPVACPAYCYSTPAGPTPEPTTSPSTSPSGPTSASPDTTSSTSSPGQPTSTSTVTTSSSEAPTPTTTTTNAPSDTTTVSTSPTSSVPIPGGLTITINATTGLIFVYNATANIIYSIDVKASLVAVFNGTSGDAIIINYKTSIGKVISGVWYSSQVEWSVFITSITSLTIIYQRSGQTFNSSNISTTIQAQLALVLIVISGGAWAVDVGEAFSIFVEIAVEFSATYQIIISVTKTQTIIIGVGLNVWFALVKGFASVIAKDIVALIRLKIQFDLYVLTQGTTAVIKYLLLIYQANQLTFFSSTNIQVVLTVIANLGGNTTTSVTRAIYLFIQISGIIGGSVQSVAFIEFLVEYFLYASVTIEEFTQFFVEFRAIINGANSGGQYTQLIGQLDLIIAGKYTVGGISVSEIIVISVQYSTNPLKAIIAILYQLRTIINTGNGCGLLLWHLITRLTEEGGLKIVIIIVGPTLVVDVKYLGDVRGLWKYILSGITLINIFRLSTLIYNIPVIGGIIKAFQTIFVELNITITIAGVIGSIIASAIKLFTSIITGALTLPVVIEIGINGTAIGGFNHNGGGTGGTGGSTVTVSGGGSVGYSWTKIVTGQPITYYYTKVVTESGKHHEHGHAHEKRKL